VTRAIVIAIAVVALVGVADAGASKPRHRCHGKAHRCAVLKRVRVREPLVERLSPTVGLRQPGGGESGQGGGSGAIPPALGRFVSVSAREYSFTLSRPIVGAGSVTVELRNVGEDPHNLIVSPDDGSHLPLASWTDTDPGTTQRRSVTLGAGQYLLWCSLPDHEAQGMHAQLVVQ
jgi:plastocyanin